MYRHNIHEKRDIKTAKSELEYHIVAVETTEIIETYHNRSLAELVLYYLVELGHDCEILVTVGDVDQYKYCQQF